MVWIAPGRDSMEAAVLNRWHNACAERRLLIVAAVAGDGGDFTANDLVGAWRVVEQREGLSTSIPIGSSSIVTPAAGPFASVLAFEHREQVRGLALASSLLQVPPPEARPQLSVPVLFFRGAGRSDGGPCCSTSSRYYTR